MTRLSAFIRFSPKLFYLAAIIVFALSIALQLHEFNRYGYSPALRPVDGQMQVAVFRMVLQESINALFLLANGVVAEILIAIWDKIAPRSQESKE